MVTTATHDGACRRPGWALPAGCGRLGAMVFGGVAGERLQLNEDTRQPCRLVGPVRLVPYGEARVDAS
ncbi:glycoside hydrolase N-terminal domain-containing protein [Nonomuraea turkmeniaca]|uniref:glycoside hydrolase N-terminal domain-containing protein n=1 Tax=Nonomuraea turkmeniaca TaxID=103838 RepID=UPI001B879FE2|nr:glycoside hydrolase N-terminal domain-containing protein [Nonomuraea turkmeniaca]